MKLEKKTTFLILAAILVLAAVLRLANLGFSAFRGDEFVYSTVETSLLELWGNPPWHNQIPLGESICIIANRILPGEASHFTIRLPFAIMGIAAVWAVYLFGAMVFDRRIGLLAAFFTAINPAHIYLSREAYHYSGVIFFSTLVLCAFWRCWRQIERGQLPSWKACALWLLAGIVAAHTHMQTWFVFGTQWLLLLTMGNTVFREPRSRFRKLAARLAAVAALFVLAISRWALRAFIEVKDVRARGAMLGNWSEFWGTVMDIAPCYTFGGWLPGVVLLATIAAAGVWLYRRNRGERKSVAGQLGAVLLAEFLVLVIVIQIVGKGRVKMSYFSALFPLLMVLTAFGGCGLAEFLAVKTRAGRLVAYALVTAALCIYNIAPARAVVQLPGKPYPYKKILHWIEENLPEKDLILAKGICMSLQMHYYVPANSAATFLLPLNLKPDLKTKLRIKEQESRVLHRFARRFPEAVVIGYDRIGDPQLEGIIDWNLQHYYRTQKSFTNEPALRLRRRKAVPLPGFYGHNLEGIVTVVSYNTPADIMESARETGQPLALSYGRSWDFAKTKDYRNWHILRGSATLNIYNATKHPVSARLKITGVASGGEKVVNYGEERTIRFPANEIVEKETLPLTLNPGHTRLAFESENEEPPLLVQKIDFRASGTR